MKIANKMNNTDLKKVKVIPVKGTTGVPDILPNNEMITEETVMDLNVTEIKRAMCYAAVQAANDTNDTVISGRFLDPFNFDDVIPEPENNTAPDTKTEETETVD